MAPTQLFDYKQEDAFSAARSHRDPALLRLCATAGSDMERSEHTGCAALPPGTPIAGNMKWSG